MRKHQHFKFINLAKYCCFIAQHFKLATNTQAITQKANKKFFNTSRQNYIPDYHLQNLTALKHEIFWNEISDQASKYRSQAYLNMGSPVKEYAVNRPPR